MFYRFPPLSILDRCSPDELGEHLVRVISNHCHQEDRCRTMIEMLLDIGASTEKIPELFNKAVASGSANVCRMILMYFDINPMVDNNHSYLHTTSIHGYLDFCMLLVEYGFDVNRRNINGQTPLHLAARWGHLDVVKFLVSVGADVNSVDNIGEATALELAILYNQVDVFEFLVSKGAESHRIDISGRSTITNAYMGANLKLCNRLLSMGVRPTERDVALCTSIRFLHHKNHRISMISQWIPGTVAWKYRYLINLLQS